MCRIRKIVALILVSAVIAGAGGAAFAAAPADTAVVRGSGSGFTVAGEVSLEGGGYVTYALVPYGAAVTAAAVKAADRQYSADGAYSFEVNLPPAADTVKYTLYLSHGFRETPLERTVTLASQTDKNAALDKLNAGASAASVASRLEEEVKPGISVRDVLNLDAAMADGIDASVAYAFLAESGPYGDAADAFDRYRLGTLVGSLAKLASGAEIKSLIEKEAQLFSLITSEEKTVFLIQNVIPQNRFSDVYAHLVKKDISGPAEFDAAFAAAVGVVALNSAKGGRLDAQKVIDNVGERMGISSADMARYNSIKGTEKQNAVDAAMTLKGFSSPSAAVSAFKSALDSALKTAPSPNGGFGGGGGGLGGAYQSDIMMEGVPTPTIAPIAPEWGGEETAERFRDLGSVAWARDAVNALYVRGVISGREEGVFAPEEDVTREEFVKMAVGAFALSREDAAARFDDVSEEEWYYPYVASAYAAGIINGISDSLFGVGENVTREDAAVILYRAAAAKGIELTRKREVSFADEGDISQYAAKAVATMANAGIVNGDGEGFSPRRSLTRGEAAKLIYETLKLS